MKKIVASILMSAAIAAPVFAADAPAADNAFYMGANIGFTKASSIAGKDATKANGGLFSLVGGYQLNKYFATEIQYAYLGKAEYNTIRTNASATTNSFGLNALGLVPVSNSFSLYGKFGLAFNIASVSNFSASVSGKTRFMPTIGMGVQYNVVPTFGLRAGWDRYDAKVEDTGTAYNYHKNAWSLGGLYRF